ncbi:CatB-related O-acetyltransferase [Pseudomonas syringae group genomosp. 3]|uniref:CatB-related O-acetyltransferase n=1 Tax=Pseudomonas syringae group genomosp. 3 TaxID=251701 RepID=UPI0006E53020|nr:CatB-related O-acetyltransferase [Pseudomonas syringae group genomosp. 3]KPW59711.1 Acetyltransferase, CysE/LacA/LpxA/NodL family protein [Pseudomonas syringae pv. berberidis]KPY28561.1 Acetyltransferase, CysE/LacA/LpxA/NodL family protein [Pseudomonas syringae pv. philadelphi]RMM14429.1 Acetyltransferase, CysE/LacA/LpxA/NodL protein [Pseudomonas syringae pv. berberidis]RMP62051.1 Acetyltransferase, CysE/LacA/LpxA/NodL protein [Pseudomonas syringae pv. berberidis]RMQ31309.1 Acetyltransferas
MKFIELLKTRKVRRQLRKMDKLERHAEKIRLKYPRAVVGVGTYGIPDIVDFGDNSILRVGSYTSIAEGVKILLGGEHRTDWITTYPFPAMVEQVSDIQDYAPSKGDVVIGSDCWICANAVIVSGVTIGHGAIVGAGAMVVRDVAPYSVVGGNPCKFIRWRFEEDVRDLLLQAAWWDWPMEEVKSVARTLCSSDMDAFLAYIRQRQASMKQPAN